MRLTADSFPTDTHGWSELLPARQATEPLVGRHRFAWAVVGAGFTGLAAARRLAELHPEQQVVLLDARQVGQGASGRNSGYAVAVSQFGGPFDPDQAAEYQRINRINMAGLDVLRRLIDGYGINCQWREAGIYHAAVDKAAVAECADFIGYLQRLNLPHTPLSQADIQERLGTAMYQTGVHVPLGALLQPAALVRGLAANLPQNVTLYEGSPVLDLSKGAPLTLTTPQGQLIADKVILATNYEAPKLGYLNRAVVGSTLAGSFTRVLTDVERTSLGSLTNWGLLSLHGGGASVRLTTDGRISLRNTAEYRGGALLSEPELAERQKIHRAAFEARFPQLRDVPFEFAWSGVEGISGNFTNFFGQQRDGIYLAGGYNGSGVSKGTAFGHALAEYASGKDTELVRDCLASKPAQWLPPRPLLDVGAYFKVRSRFKQVGKDR